MNPRYLDGPDEPQEWPCQADGCVDGQVPASTFARNATRDCEECQGLGVVELDPDDFIDPDRDETLLYDDVDHNYGESYA